MENSIKKSNASNQSNRFFLVWRRKSHIETILNIRNKNKLALSFFSLVVRCLNIKINDASNSPFFSLHILKKCYTLSFFSINNDELIEFSLSYITLFVLFFLLTRCDVRQCAYTFLIQFLSPSKFNCFIHIWCACLSTSSFYLSKSFALLNIQKKKENEKTRIFSSFSIQMNLSSTSIKEWKSPSSTCHHYILVHVLVIHLYIYNMFKKKTKKEKEKMRAGLDISIEIEHYV